MTDVNEQQRVLESFTAAAEKRLLVAMCDRMPARVNSDHLTAVGLLGSFGVFAGFALSRLSPGWLALSIAGIVLNWFGDSMDGTLARVRHRERPRYGFYIDHSVDVIAEALVFLGLGVSPYVRLDIACLALIGYLALSVEVFIRSFTDGVFRISFSKLGPTEMRLILVAVILTMLFAGQLPLYAPLHLTWYDGVAGSIGMLLGGVFISQVLRGKRELADIDTRE